MGSTARLENVFFCILFLVESVALGTLCLWFYKHLCSIRLLFLASCAILDDFLVPRRLTRDGLEQKGRKNPLSSLSFAQEIRVVSQFIHCNGEQNHTRDVGESYKLQRLLYPLSNFLLIVLLAIWISY